MKNNIKQHYSFQEFKEIWIEQETLNTDEANKLINALDESDDFEEIFEVIASWSNKPLDERLEKFLRNNNKDVVKMKTVTINAVQNYYKSADFTFEVPENLDEDEVREWLDNNQEYLSQWETAIDEASLDGADSETTINY